MENNGFVLIKIIEKSNNSDHSWIRQKFTMQQKKLVYNNNNNINNTTTNNDNL